VQTFELETHGALAPHVVSAVQAAVMQLPFLNPTCSMILCCNRYDAQERRLFLGLASCGTFLHASRPVPVFVVLIIEVKHFAGQHMYPIF
jgi:small ligand-binding sensory domain FIST